MDGSVASRIVEATKTVSHFLQEFKSCLVALAPRTADAASTLCSAVLPQEVWGGGLKSKEAVVVLGRGKATGRENLRGSERQEGQRVG